MKINCPNTRRQSGFSLLELLLVVAVGAVLILAGLGAYRLVSENNNTNQATRLLTTLKQQVQQAYQGQSTYGDANTNILGELADMRALPSDLGTNGTGTGMTAKGPFGPIEVNAQGNRFEIVFTNVPRGACIRLGQQFSAQNANDFISLVAGGTTFDQTSGAITQAQMTAACSDTAANNEMTWTFQ